MMDISVHLHTKKPHPVYKIVRQTVESGHLFKDFAVLHAELQSELDTKGVKLPAFPDRFTKSSLS